MREVAVTNLDGSSPETGIFARAAAGDESGPSLGSTARFGTEFSQALAAAAEVSPEDREAVASLPAGSALLVVRRGPDAGARFLLDRDVSAVGRHPEADVFLDDVTVSRRHAEFRRRDGRFEVVDLGSLNGTYYDGSRIDAAALTGGAEVQIGKFRLTFYPSPADAETGA